MSLHKKCCIILSCFMLLAVVLSGCDENGNEPRETTGEMGQVASTGEPEPVPLITVRGTGSQLMEFDPQRSIYFSCDGMDLDMDIYMRYTCGPGFSFYIYSVKALDLHTLKIDIPVETKYKVEAHAKDVCQEILTEGPVADSAEMLSCFPYYLYQVHRGTDFERIRQLWEASDSEFKDYRDAELGSFYDLTEADIPEFFVYYVRIDFDYISCTKDESFREMTITLGGQTYPIAIGEVRLFPTASPYSLESGSYTNESGIASAGQLQQLYNDGLGNMYDLFQVTAEENMTITGLKAHGNDLEILELHVELTGGNAISYQWDGTSPIYLSQGDTLQIHAIYRSAKTNNLSYYIRSYFELDYETDDENACVTTEYTLLPNSVNLHELFAIVFMGVDMESYYRNYYYPLYEPWRQDYLS